MKDNQLNNFEHDVVRGIHTFTISAMTSFSKIYPELYDILLKSKRPSNDWDFYMTSAGIGVLILSLKSDQEQIKKFIETATEIDIQIPQAINNFFEFIEKYDTLDTEFPSKVGVWVLWNIGGECPSHKTMEKLAPAIGSYIKNLVNEFIVHCKS